MVNPTLDQWRRLYDLMGQVKDLAPWQWMMETQVFGVKEPDTGGLNFVSVMGRMGEHYGVAVYLGARGLYQFWGVQHSGPEVDLGKFLEMPQIHASFEARNLLTEQDRAVIRRLNLKFRGSNAWPQFRSHVPGYAPWYIDVSDAHILIPALEQLLEVAPRIKADPNLLPDPERKRYLVRVSEGEDDARTWSDREQYVQPPGMIRLNMPMDTNLLAQVRALPKRLLKVEMDLFLVPTPVHDHPSGRPYFPYMLLMLDVRTGAIVGQELLQPIPELKSVWEMVPLAVLAQLARLPERPAIIYVPNEMLAELVKQLAQELNIRLTVRPQLRHMPHAKQSLMAFMQGGAGSEFGM